MESHPGMTDSKAPQAADHEGRWETAGRAGGPPLFHEDFSAFPVGQLPYDYSPIGEYHCVIPEGYLGPWVELTTHHSWRRSVGWNIGEDGGRKHLEHVALREAIPSILAAGDPLWGDAELTVELRLPAREKAAGLAFRLQTSQQYYALLLGADGTASLVKADFDNCLTVLAVAALPAVPDGWHRAQIRLDGPRMQAVLDGQTTLTAEDDEYQRGRIALVAWAPARYREVDVRASAPEASVRAGLCSQEAREQAALLERLPRPVLWSSFELGDAGAGRTIRFGDLDGDGEIEILMAQCVERGGTDNIAGISCLTAFKLSGEVLWQVGEPHRRHGLISADVPLQIHDLDGDGHADVVLCKDFMVRVLDGRTGALKQEQPTPAWSGAGRLPSSDDLFDRLNGDSLFFADLAGRGARRDLLLKNRYGAIWALDAQLNLLWQHGCKTGHSPFVGDWNGDGRDEVLIGSTMLDADGRALWSMPTDDHVDTAAVVTLKPGGDPVVLLACSDQGLYFLDLEGRLIRNDRVGHAQDLAIGRFRDDLPGLQFWTKTFWGHPGILFLYSADLERIVTRQEYPFGSMVYPLHWEGGEIQHVLVSAHPELGGVMDGRGCKAPLLPADGHPWMCCQPLDVTGDCRDEILCWDLERFWIYTQDRPASGELIPLQREPLYNFTNYGAHLALP
jgi:rhamnogalacturonan endolyase